MQYGHCEKLRKAKRRSTAQPHDTVQFDQLVRSLPPAHWHRAQYDRIGATEQRIAALERVVQQLTWSSAPPPPDGHRVATYDGAPRGRD